MQKIPGWVKPHPIALRDGVLLGVFVGWAILFARMESWWIAGVCSVLGALVLLSDYTTWFDRIVLDAIRRK